MSSHITITSDLKKNTTDSQNEKYCSLQIAIKHHNKRIRR